MLLVAVTWEKVDLEGIIPDVVSKLSLGIKRFLFVLANPFAMALLA